MDKSKIKWLAGVIVVALAILGAGMFLLSKKEKLAEKVNYVISGVPYIGLYNHTGQNRVISGDTPSTVISILEYWNPGRNNYVEVYRSIRNSQRFITGESVMDYLNKSGYAAKEVHLEDNELKQYINSNAKTPLFAFLAVDENQPEKDLYHPATVIIGINESEGKVIVHDYWLGNNYAISFADFDQRWSRMRKDEQKNYIIIQPQDLNKKLAELKTRKIEAYSERTSTMNNTESMMKNYALGYGSNLSTVDSLTMDYFSKVEKDPSFENNLPPYFKSLTYYHLADLYLKEKNTDQALAYAQKAIDVDNNIDQPFNDWPGFETEYGGDVTGKLSDPWAVMGDILLETKNYPKAKDAYEMALKITPNKAGIADKLKMIETALLQVK